MSYIFSYICWLVGAVVVFFAISFVYNFIKSLNDPRVKIASMLGMTIGQFNDCEKLWEEYAVMLRKDENARLPRQPKNTNAWMTYGDFRMHYDLKNGQYVKKLSFSEMMEEELKKMDK